MARICDLIPNVFLLFCQFIQAESSLHVDSVDQINHKASIVLQHVRSRAHPLTLNFPTNLSSLVPSSSLAFPLNSSYVFTQSSKCPNSPSSSLLYSCGETQSIISWSRSHSDILERVQYDPSLSHLSFESFISLIFSFTWLFLLFRISIKKHFMILSLTFSVANLIGRTIFVSRVSFSFCLFFLSPSVVLTGDTNRTYSISSGKQSHNTMDEVR